LQEKLCRIVTEQLQYWRLQRYIEPGTSSVISCVLDWYFQDSFR